MVKVMMIEFTSSQRPKMPQGHGSKNKNKTKKSSELLIQVFFFFLDFCAEELLHGWK